MNGYGRLFAGIILAFVLSWVGLVLVPLNQVGNLTPVEDQTSGEMNPPAVSGLAKRGSHVYAANGCASCHTQQVRSSGDGSDIAREWGTRQTVARDYLYQANVNLGTMRLGPDLANMGSDRPSLNENAGAKKKYDAQSLHQLFYAPSSIPGSSHPSYAFLYQKREIKGNASEGAVKLSEGYAAPEGTEIVPSEDAKALVAYLLSLNRTYALPEAPVKP
ncbi:MAG: cbb3-type cytochrome c oxidase subunit II [Verrucomicrobiota bacterium]